MTKLLGKVEKKREKIERKLAHAETEKEKKKLERKLNICTAHLEKGKKVLEEEAESTTDKKTVDLNGG